LLLPLTVESVALLLALLWVVVGAVLDAALAEPSVLLPLELSVPVALPSAGVPPQARFIAPKIVKV
jgi:hypothetical protein